MVNRYRTKPCEIEAIQWNGTNLEEIKTDEDKKKALQFVSATFTLVAFKTALADAKSNFKYIVEAWENGDALDAYLNNGLTDSVLNFDFNDIIVTPNDTNNK